ncbi:hypothetical protein P4133_25545 [Pseudomonas aeruginosa]|nr:hypothetical protein [Pseudomonas aeruginosa]
MVVALVGALVFWRLDHVTAQRDDLQAAVEQSAETITAMAQQAQRDAQAQVQADALARTYQAALQASHEENQLRRDAIGTGARVVYVKARCPAGGVHQAPGPPAALMQEEPSLLPLMDRLFLISEPESSAAN